jgi:hypothetical protein
MIRPTLSHGTGKIQERTKVGTGAKKRKRKKRKK